MPVTVDVTSADSLEVALARLNRKVGTELGRRWYKRRFGYFEKPSALRRKRKQMDKLAIASGGGLWLKIGLKEQFCRHAGSGVGR
ncbi:30S ribosomal protein S21 [Ectopseudomonas khazarica]|uniref:30S ribosomal protein S21 n=1 Tax=Ectopseudomonas khazarica TaxID=2502979 RepID=UPI003A93D349